MGDIAKSRAMRKSMNPAEARLWSRLKVLRKSGLHFRRQHPLSGYFLDFVCLDRRVIVEVDGASHQSEERGRKDHVRDAAMARDGFVTLRFENLTIRDEVDAVIEIVTRTCLARPTRSSLGEDHPPRDGEGEV